MYLNIYKHALLCVSVYTHLKVMVTYINILLKYNLETKVNCVIFEIYYM